VTARAVACLVLLLGACSADEAPAPAAQGEQVQTSTVRAGAAPDGSTPITAVGDLLGEYRVAGVDGEELGGQSGIAVSIDGPVLSFEPTCAGFVWNIAEGNEGFAFTRANRQADGTVVACAIAVPPEYDRLGTAIDAVRHAWRTPANGVLLEGAGRSVLLFSQ